MSPWWGIQIGSDTWNQKPGLLVILDRSRLCFLLNSIHVVEIQLQLDTLCNSVGEIRFVLFKWRFQSHPRLALDSDGQTLQALREHSFFRGPPDAFGEENEGWAIASCWLNLESDVLPGAVAGWNWKVQWDLDMDPNFQQPVHVLFIASIRRIVA